MSHNLMLPKETVGQGIPEKSSDWTCIEKKVRGVPPLGGAPEPPGAPLAIKAVGEEGCVGVRLLSVDCTCALNNEAMNAKVSEVVDRAARMLKVTHSIPDPAGTFRRAVVKVVPALSKTYSARRAWPEKIATSTNVVKNGSLPSPWPIYSAVLAGLNVKPVLFGVTI